MAGTTRDLVSDVVDLEGLAVRLVDSAGIRATSDAVEAEGVDRARQAVSVASAVIVVLDRSRPLEDEDHQVLEETESSRRVVTMNKMDQPSRWTSEVLSLGSEEVVVAVSAMTGEGLDGLRGALRTVLVGGGDVYRDTPTVANQRHIGLLERAGASLGDAEGAARDGATEEFVLADLQRARMALEELTGKRTPDDVVNHIFERFCIGK